MIRNSLIAVVVLLAGLWGVAVLGPRAEGITSGTCIGGQEGICNAGAAIGGASGISMASVAPSAAVVCTFTTGSCIGVGGGSSLFTAATCNGIVDDSGAFNSFNSWAVSSAANIAKQQIELLIPPGSTCMWLSGAANGLWAAGISNFLVVAYGATMSNNNSSSVWWYFGTQGQYNDNAHSARTATVSSGSSFVTLTTVGQTSLFTVGQYALMSGFDLEGEWHPAGQGFGFPTNPQWFEYVLVTAKDGACQGTGTVCFSVPLANSYESTWPLYDPGSVNGVDEGGPATLYALNPNWDAQIEYRGLTVSTPNVGGSSVVRGRSITFRDATFTTSSCADPSEAGTFVLINTSLAGCDMEVDKIIGTVSMSGVIIYEIDFQSSSTNLFQMTGSTVTNAIQGTPKRAIISDSTIASLNPGAYAYGRSDETVCTNCIISAIAAKGANENGTLSAGTWAMSGTSGGPYNATMTNGIITVPNTHGAVTWAVPGANITWSCCGGESVYVYQVVDVTQDVTNTYVQTNCVGSGTICGVGGGFPAAVTTGALSVRAHPAPKFTCTNCSGATAATALNSATPGAPLYSYAKVTYDETWPISSTNSVDVWGKVTSLNFTVTNPYGGAGALSFFPMYQFGYGTFEINGTKVNYTPKVDLKTGGLRTVTTSGVTGGGGTDSGLALPADVWLGGATVPNISAHPGGSETITVELITNQGVVIPAQYWDEAAARAMMLGANDNDWTYQRAVGW